MSFRHAVSEGSLDTFKCDSCVEPRVLYLVAVPSLVFSTVETAGKCAILDGSEYDMATAPMARKIMRSIDWLAVTLESVAQLLHFTIASGTIPVLTIESATGLVQDEKKLF